MIFRHKTYMFQPKELLFIEGEYQNKEMHPISNSPLWLFVILQDQRLRANKNNVCKNIYYLDVDNLKLY